MKRYLIGVLILGSLTLTGCNTITRNFGGTQTINLEPNKKLVNLTWKEDSLWVLTKDMSKDDKAETYTFKEDSNFGVLNGTVTVNEVKQ